MRFGRNTIERGIRVLLRTVIKLVSFIDHRVYMRLYNAYLRRVGVRLTGQARYISSTAKLDGADFSLIELGDGVVISSGVRILTHDFSVDRILQTDPENTTREAFVARPVVLGDDVFVGAGSILLPGANIGARSIVGAGSVVRGTIPPASLVIGNPAEVIGTADEHVDHYRIPGGPRQQALRWGKR